MGGSDGKASAYNAGDPGSIPESGRSPGEGNGNPLQYSCLENSMDGGAWLATVHGVAESRTRLSDFTSPTPVFWPGEFHGPYSPLERLMLKLKLQYFGHLMRRTDSVEKTLILGNIEVRGEGGDRG